jgi:ankyrin repeat protein
MINYKFIVSTLFFVSGALSYTQADDGLTQQADKEIRSYIPQSVETMQQVGKQTSPYIPPVKSWYQQRQEEQKKRAFELKAQDTLSQIFNAIYPGKKETELLRSLLDQGLDPNKREQYSDYSLITRMAYQGMPEAISLLLQKGAHPEYTTVWHAMSYDRLGAEEKVPAMLKALLDGGLNVNFQDPNSGNTPLHIAANLDRPDLAEILLAHGANPQLKNHANETPADIIARGQKQKEFEEEHGKHQQLIEVLDYLDRTR